MPENVIYWWGYEDSNLEDCISANGWNAGGNYTLLNPTHNTHNIALSAGTGQVCAVGINNATLSTSNVKSIIKGINISGQQYGSTQITSSKNMSNVATYTLIQSNDMMLYSQAYSSGYYSIEVDSNRAVEVYALLYE